MTELEIKKIIRKRKNLGEYTRFLDVIIENLQINKAYRLRGVITPMDFLKKYSYNDINFWFSCVKK